MGYTHYWSAKTIRGKAAELEAKYKRALLDCQRVAKQYNAECKAKGLDDERLSGYSAHTKLGQYGGLELNGKGDLDCETFSMREHFNQIDNDFCKTARMPYDIVVVACLAILKHRLGDAFSVSSDGDASDWELGVKLARRITGLKIKNPIAISRAKVAA